MEFKHISEFKQQRLTQITTILHQKFKQQASSIGNNNSVKDLHDKCEVFGLNRGFWPAIYDRSREFKFHDISWQRIHEVTTYAGDSGRRTSDLDFDRLDFNPDLRSVEIRQSIDRFRPWIAETWLIRKKNYSPGIISAIAIRWAPDFPIGHQSSIDHQTDVKGMFKQIKTWIDWL